jgi:glycogen(starch) synthase
MRKVTVYLTANLFVDHLFSNANAIISISPYFASKSRFLSKYQDKTVNIPNGVNLEKYNTRLNHIASKKQLGLPTDRPLILFLGSLIPRKGADILLEAMRIVINKFPIAELILVGRGPMLGQLKKQASELELDQHIRYEGFIGENALKSLYYRAADVFVVPSVNNMEMFPLVLLEGSALGCAMVVSDLETFKCIIKHGYNGIVSKAGDPKSFADGIISILSNPNLQRHLSKNAEEYVQQFSWQAIAKKTEELYQQFVPSVHTRKSQAP